MSIQQNMRTEVGLMSSTSTKVDGIATQIDGDLKRLDNLISAVPGTWQGSGASAFMALHQRWVERQTELRRILAEISLGINQNSIAYQTNEDNVLSVMNQTTAALA
jgi:WXG100 family type VII secretion target